MKSLIRYILLSPLSILYGLITWTRNKLYQFGVLKSYSPSIPTIVVGNLAVGGTGKTPHIELLLNILSTKYKTAVLSRGYKRKTKGFILADTNSNCNSIGDEPFQLYRKFANISIAVAEKRVQGILQLQKSIPNLELVLFDDAFQHRAINPGLKLILTDYSNLYCTDSMLPGGNLREYATGAQRADIIIVTKCPLDLTEQQSKDISKKLKIKPNQQLYFSAIVYDSIKPLFETKDTQLTTPKLQDSAVLLVTGIVSHRPLVQKIEASGATVKTMAFADHHQFTLHEYTDIEQDFISLPNSSKIILITEKDAARIYKDENYPEALKKHTFYIPITIEILHNKQILFANQIKNYVETYKRNG